MRVIPALRLPAPLAEAAGIIVILLAYASGG